MKRLWVLASVVLGLVSCDTSDTERVPSRGAAPVAIDAVRAERLEVEQLLEAIGSLVASEKILVSSEVPGIVESIHFEEGQRIDVARGERPVLVALDTALLDLEVQNASARLALAAAEVEEKRAVFERKKQMWEEDAASEAVYTDSRLALERAKASEKLAATSLAIARERLSKAAIRAPISGVVGERTVGPGDYVDAGEPMVELVQLDPLEVSFSVPERYRGLLRTGLEARVRSEAFPGEEFRGAVFFLSPVADRDTRSIRMKARISNPDGSLKPGIFVKVWLVVGEAEDSVVVPEEAVVPRGEKFFVYTVEPRDQAEAELDPSGEIARRREVRLGQRLPGKVVVSAGLEGSETVIVAGLQKVSDGSPVRVRAGGEG